MPESQTSMDDSECVNNRRDMNTTRTSLDIYSSSHQYGIPRADSNRVCEIDSSDRWVEIQ